MIPGREATLLLVVLLFGSFLSFLTLEVEAADVSGIINQDTTWTSLGSPYTLTGNILVANGVTLTIQPGATVNLGSYYIQVNGTLITKGSTSNPIRLNSGSITYTTYATPYNNQSDSGCTIENAVLTSTAVSSNIALKITQCTINAALTVTGDSVVSNNNIVGNVNGGYLTNNNIVGDVSSLSIFNNKITGTVTGGTVSNNNIVGLVTGVYISNNTILGATSGYGNGGISMSAGYLFSTTYPVIENNLISNCQVGINVAVLIRAWFGSKIPTIQNNLITNNQVGIQYEESIQEPWAINKTIIQNNNIKQNQVGVKLGSNSLCTILHNNIEQNVNYSIQLQTSVDVNLTNNYWGTTNQQAIQQSFYDYNKDFNLGRITFTPFSEAAYPVGATPPYPTSTPTPTPTGSSSTPTPTTQPTPTPTIPEISLPAIILPLAAVALAAILFYRRKHVP